MRSYILIALVPAWALSLAAAPAVQLTAASDLTQPVGTLISWTASATDVDAGSLDYQFSAGPAGGALTVVQDFDISNALIWAAPLTEGPYTFQVIARNLTTGAQTVAQQSVTVTSLLQGDLPLATATANPLVALFSAPPCPTGSTMMVRFGTGSDFTETNASPCNPNSSMNFYVGGMRPNTTYSMAAVVADGETEVEGPGTDFTTGAIDSTLDFPTIELVHETTAPPSQHQGVLLLDFLSPGYEPIYYFPTALDLEGRVIWYYPALGNIYQQGAYYIRPLANSQGHLLLIADDQNAPLFRDQILREIDLAGNVVQQTDVTRVNEQLVAQGKVGIIDFDHDAVRLPNGHTLVICAQEQMYAAGTQESTTPVDIVGDAVVDLDQNLQVTWSWSAYDQLDISRRAILNETCTNVQGCPPIQLASVANDWLHANSLNYIPDNGDFLISLRNQDWIARVTYANGTGDGHVVWQLGTDGDFTMNSTQPFVWFSHQHEVEYEQGGTSLLSLFDNGNTRHTQNQGSVQNSRGYVLDIDETSRTVTPALIVDLGYYSPALGSAQLLDNGDYHFDAGYVGAPPSEQAFAFEVTPDGTIDYIEENNTFIYRSYRMGSLYDMDGYVSRSTIKGIHPPGRR